MYKMNRATQMRTRTEVSLLLEKVKELLDKLMDIERKLLQKDGKMMEGFRCIEKSFRLMAGAIISMSDDLGSATGTLSTDPWAFDA